MADETKQSTVSDGAVEIDDATATATATESPGSEEGAAGAEGSEVSESSAGTEAIDPNQSAAGEAGDSGLQLYNFKRPTRVGGDRLRTLSAMHEILAASLSEWLTARFRESIDVTLGDFEETTFGGIVRSLPKPCAIYYFEVNSAPDLAAMISLDPNLAFASVDRLLGGTAEAHIEDRALSGLEQRVAGIIADRLRIATETIWRDHVAFRLTPEGFESIPDLLQVAEMADPYLAARLDMKAPSWEGHAVIYLPFRMLETALGVGAADGDIASPEQERSDIEASVVAASVTVDVRFPAFPLPLGVIGSLEEGMVLRTRIPVDANLDISICGQKRFIGTPGRMGQDLAVRILEPNRETA